MNLVVASRSTFKNHPINQFVADRIDEVNDAVGDQVAANAMHVFDGWGPAIDPSSYTPNMNFWIPSVLPQLTGCPVWISGGWKQAAGCYAITPRHGLTTDHFLGWGPAIGQTVRFANNDTGATFETTILDRQYHVQAFTEGVIVLFADELPAWVNKFPMIRYTLAKQYLLGPLNPPLLCLSQGNVSDHATPGANTPNNFKLYVRRFFSSTAYGAGNAANFYHNISPGDSGMPVFMLFNGTLYAINSNGGAYFYDKIIDSINSSIEVVDAKHSITTGYTVQTIADPMT
jgi:hypothetical protein